MPLFEFHCEDCNKDVELLIGRNEKAVCPTCGSKKMEKLMSAAAGRVAGGSLPMLGSSCPPPEAGPCSPHCCRLPQ